MTCPTCARGLAPNLARCPKCGAPNPNADPTITRGGDTDPSEITAEFGPAGAGEDSIVGFVVVYSESSEDPISGPESKYGRAYPLRSSDVFFAGKPPLPTEVQAGESKKAPTVHHLFPAIKDFDIVSRRHLVLEMRPSGETVITDMSTNGTYLRETGQHLKKGMKKISGRECLLLGLNLGSSTDSSLREKVDRYQLQIIPLKAKG